jgi:hypothetical protein
MGKKKFISLSSNRLTLEDLAGLTGETIVVAQPIVSQLGSTGANIMNNLINNLNLMQTSLDRARNSPFTKPIQETNQACDGTMGDIKRTVKAGSKSIMPVIAAAGTTMMFFIKPFWDIDKGNIVTQIKLTDEMISRYNSDVSLTSAAATLGITNHFSTLSDQNKLLGSLYQQRLAEQGSSVPPASTYHSDVAEGYDNLCLLVLKTLNFGIPTPELIAAFIEMDSIRMKYAAGLSARKNIHNHLQTKIEDQICTGYDITPDTVTNYIEKDKDPVRLYRGKDYDNSYNNNVQIGIGRMIFHGKGKYIGSETVTFNIVAPPAK